MALDRVIVTLSEPSMMVDKDVKFIQEILGEDYRVFSSDSGDIIVEAENRPFLDEEIEDKLAGEDVGCHCSFSDWDTDD